MKKVFLLFTFIAITMISFSQDKEKNQSNAEKFSSKSGTLIQKEFIDIGSIKGAKLKVVQYKDLINSTKQSALRFEYESVGKYTNDTKIAVLDVDEIDGLIKSIKIIQEKIFSSVATNYTEVSYKSRGGFEAGCFWGKDKWSAYLKLEAYDSDSFVFLKEEDFSLLLDLLEKAKTQL